MRIGRIAAIAAAGALAVAVTRKLRSRSDSDSEVPPVAPRSTDGENKTTRAPISDSA